MEFQYTKKGSVVCVDKILDPDREVMIPETIGGCPVAELGAYVLAGTEVESVHMPETVIKIGAYAFYGCKKLKKLYFHGTLEDIGTGIFADTRDIAFLDVTMKPGQRTCLKDILQELHQTVRVRLHEDGVESRLIFPEFYEEVLENTPGRQINSQMHGCGLTYRYSFHRRVFQPKSYDELFYMVTVQEPEELVCELAIGRLQYPQGLSERDREVYERYLREHWKAAAQVLIEADRTSLHTVTNLNAGDLPWLAESIVRPEEEQVQEMVKLAQTAGDTEMVSWLMDYRHRMFAGNGGNGQEKSGDLSAPKRRRKFEL